MGNNSYHTKNDKGTTSKAVKGLIKRLLHVRAKNDGVLHFSRWRKITATGNNKEILFLLFHVSSTSTNKGSGRKASYRVHAHEVLVVLNLLSTGNRSLLYVEDEGYRGGIKVY